MNEQQKQALTQELAFELYTAQKPFGPGSFGMWSIRSWRTKATEEMVAGYDRMAARVLELIELGAESHVDSATHKLAAFFVLGAGVQAAQFEREGQAR